MAGSWEFAQANQVLCAILHTDNTTLAWSFGLRNLIIPGKEEHRLFDPFLPLAGMPYDHARNSAVQHMLQCGAEWLFSYDSDVIPPRDAILRLLAHRQPFISGMYCRRSPPHGLPVMIRNGTWITDFVPGSIVEADLVGAGCLLTHRSVFEKLPPTSPGNPWFHWRVNQQGILPPGDCLSEDFTLCQMVRRHLGIRVLVDTSIVCRHVGFAEAGPGSFTPCLTHTQT